MKAQNKSLEGKENLKTEAEHNFIQAKFIVECIYDELFPFLFKRYKNKKRDSNILINTYTCCVVQPAAP